MALVPHSITECVWTQKCGISWILQLFMEAIGGDTVNQDLHKTMALWPQMSAFLPPSVCCSQRPVSFSLEFLNLDVPLRHPCCRISSFINQVCLGVLPGPHNSRRHHPHHIPWKLPFLSMPVSSRCHCHDPKPLSSPP